jgi:hypothetical protein
LETSPIFPFYLRHRECHGWSEGFEGSKVVFEAIRVISPEVTQTLPTIFFRDEGVSHLDRYPLQRRTGGEAFLIKLTRFAC